MNAAPRVCMCADCAPAHIEARLREGVAAALRCDAARVVTAVWCGTDGRWWALAAAGDLSVSYIAAAPEDAAQGVLAALTGTLDLGGAS